MKDKLVRKELDRLKLRLFGYGNTDCLNVSSCFDTSNSILSGHRVRISRIEDNISNLDLKFNNLLNTVSALNDKLEKVKRSKKK